MMIASSVLLAAFAYANLTWRSIGPAVSGGRVASVAGRRRRSALLHRHGRAAAFGNRSTAARPGNRSSKSRTSPAIGAVAIDPTNENVVWAGTGEANPRNNVSYGDGLYKSTDGAKTWQRVGLAGVWSISRIAMDPRDTRHVVVARSEIRSKIDRSRRVRHVRRRRDVEQVALPLAASGASDIAMDPRDPDVVYAGMWHFRRLPWTFTSGGPDGGLYKSTDGGRTWSRLDRKRFAGGATPAVSVFRLLRAARIASTP